MKRFLAAVLAALGLAAPLPAQLAASKPNIILVITDDQGYGALGRHGHPWLRTPNLDALHDQSLRFTRFLVSPTCSPTRSALMTGRHPLKNGVTHTILERERLTLQATLLPQVLQSAGYRCGIFGKWHLGDEDPYQPQRRGFDEVFIHGGGGIGQAYNCSCADAPGNAYTDPAILHNGTFVKTRGFCSDVFFTAALGWIKQRRDHQEPFFAYLAPNAPHAPYRAPAKNAQRFADLGFPPDQAGFYGMIENLDENMGRLAAKLAEWNLGQNTAVIFMSDNGMAGIGPSQPGQDIAPGYPFFNGAQIGLKGSTDEGSLRVPFFIRWDGKIRGGRAIDTIAAHIDILPTLAALAGAALPPHQVEGRSLLPLMENPACPWPDRYLFTHVARWPTGREPNDYQFANYGVRNQRFRFVGPQGDPPPDPAAVGALYDMEADPYQTTDVIQDHPEVAAQMRAAYRAFWQEARPLMVNETAPLSPVRPFHQRYRQQELQVGGIPDWTPPAL